MPELTGILILLVLLSTSLKSKAQNLTFGVYVNNIKCGEMNVSKFIDENTISYQLKAVASVFPFMRRTLKEEFKVTYSDDRMNYSSVQRIVNNTIQEHKITSFISNGYELYRMNENIGFYEGEIKKSIITLYYCEPLNVDFIYSETFQQMLPIKKIEKGKYSVKLPDKNETVYTYRNGLCILVESTSMFYKISFKPVAMRF